MCLLPRISQMSEFDMIERTPRISGSLDICSSTYYGSKSYLNRNARFGDTTASLSIACDALASY